MEMTERDIKLMRTLNKYPEIKDSVIELCEIAEAEKHKPKLADDAEDMVVEDAKKLGAKILTRWAECRVDEESHVTEQMRAVHKHGKKK
jgi:hypothetical protein